MKDYEHIVIWLDYFNKTLSRQKGRRLAKDKCVFDPSLNELIESAKAAGLEPTETDDGKCKVISRPGQCGVINAILVK